ncbi:TSUP family transporter [Porticoccaceae bacterium]|nr:TSUP family transporter [Porticoccaceae bacterium]
MAINTASKNGTKSGPAIFNPDTTITKATAETKLMILAVNGTSALIFVFSGYVIWQLAIGMSVAQVIGARLGSNLVMKRGAGFVQPIITVITLLMALKLLFFP